MPEKNLKELAKLVRYYILTSTTKAGSGHPTSSLSATDLMTTLMFDGYFRFDTKNKKNPNNDRLIFSKGHAAPLLYSLWTVAKEIKPDDLMTLRQFGSDLEGHPTMKFPYTEAATGSLGQGLSVGVGMALNGKYLDKLDYKTYVLLGDSEMAEGSVWEAIEIASYYKLNNLIAIVDVNRLGQRGETQFGHDTKAYEKRVSAFGWKTITIDGHNFNQIKRALENAKAEKEKPVMIIAKTIKGKGVSFIEDKNGWHGKPLSEELLEKALEELDGVNKKLKGSLEKPVNKKRRSYTPKIIKVESYKNDKTLATRKAFGVALVKIHKKYPNIISLDAETSNSTFAETFKKAYPDRFFEMFIAEQNMVGTALGLSQLGKIPFVSTFAAFLSRAHDQIRMCQYSNANIKFVGSHAGSSIGEDGSSQMGLEDIGMFRAIVDSVVLYPSDAIATEKLIELSAKNKGIFYIRTTRQETPIIYNQKDTFEIGGSKTIYENKKDVATIIGAGITLHEAIKAYTELKGEGIHVRVIDLYSIKPIDTKTLEKAARETKTIIVVEDHYPEGGIGEAVMSALATHPTPVHSLAVRKMPKSGKIDEVLNYEEISVRAIIKKVKSSIK